MNYRDKILDYYKILLAIGWLKADEDGNVSLVIGDDVRAATIEGKRVVLPTRDQMKNRDWTSRIGFHPLRESYNLGISDILANLRDVYVQRLNTSIAYLFQELIAIAYDQKNQKNLNSEQAAVLDALKHVSEKTVSSFADLQKKTRARNDTDQFINIFIRKGGMVGGQTYGRAAIVSFPIYQKLLEGEEKINGVKISAKDRDMLIKLFQFVFPTIDNKESFNVGVNTKTAPFLEALVRATFGVVDQLVETSKPYMEIVSLPSLLQFPEDMGEWIEIFENKELVEKLSSSIPNLTRGDEGAEEIEERKAAATATRSERREPTKQETTVSVEKTTMTTETERPRGRMTLGAPAPHTSGDSLGKARPDQDNASGSDRARHTVARDSDIDREEARRRREQEDRERRQREREEEEERARRRREQEEDEREYRERKRQLERELDDLDRGRGRDSRDSRDDRGYRDRDRRDDRDRGRDDGRTRNTGDIFEDNPVLRSNLRDEERDSRYDSRRDDRRRDPRDSRYRDDRYDDRYRDDRYDDRYSRNRDPRDMRSRYRR